MRLYRVAAIRFAQSAAQMLDGAGARRFGGRWNSPGKAAVYCTQSMALAALEVLVHVFAQPALQRYRWLAVELPDERVVVIDDDPQQPETLTRARGDGYLGPKGPLAFSVRTTTVPVDRLVVLNPAHPDFGSCVVPATPRAFELDPHIELALRRQVRFRSA